ncbi:MAG: hypothetical protein KDA95_04165 [Acidimicrobiales bacterium]|nr:hypothetical protein [Acidimicrobiales bacterium]
MGTHHPRWRSQERPRSLSSSSIPELNEGWASAHPSPRQAIRVLPDIKALDREFDYLVAPGTDISVGDMVRVPFKGRIVAGWVTEVGVEPDESLDLKTIKKLSGRGPDSELLELARWAAWRWVGHRAHFLRTASPPAMVTGPLPATPSTPSASSSSALPMGEAGSVGSDMNPSPQPPAAIRVPDAVEEALSLTKCVLRLGPGTDRTPLAMAVARKAVEQNAQALVLCPSAGESRALGARLSQAGFQVAVLADDRSSAGARQWELAAKGASVVVGTRSAAWARLPELAEILILDEHDEAYKQEQTPCWHARDVAIERARRVGASCIAVSPCPSLEALEWGELVTEDRLSERRSWRVAEIVDQRQGDVAGGALFSSRMVQLARSDQRVLCILNRKGRVRVLACRGCNALARCESCDGVVGTLDAPPNVGEQTDQPLDVAVFACRRCGTNRPAICLECGGTGFKNLVLGVGKAREELEVLIRERVGELTANDSGAARTQEDALRCRVVIGTVALLHRVTKADSVVFMDMDQELLAPRFRASEQAMAMLAQACRLVARGGHEQGRVLVQTRSPDHPVLLAAAACDPGRMIEPESSLRKTLRLAPYAALALISGEAAPLYVEALDRDRGVKIQGPVDGQWRAVADNHQELCDLLADAQRPPGRLRVEIDPLRM